MLSGWTIQNGDEVTVTAQLCGDPIGSDSVVAIAPRPPRTPIIIAPAPGSTTSADHPVFEWKDPDAGGAYEALTAWIAENEYQVAGPPREQFMNDPTEVGQDEALTEILFPVR